MFKKGEIYLAKLNPKKGNEVGKIRPVLIYQTNYKNLQKIRTSEPKKLMQWTATFYNYVDIDGLM